MADINLGGKSTADSDPSDGQGRASQLASDRRAYLESVARGEPPHSGPLSEAGEKAAAIAKDILTPRRLGYDHPFVHGGLTDALENTLLPTANKLGIEIVLFAGVGAVIYGAPRQVSPDIDFVIPYDSRVAPEQVQQLMTELTGSDIPIQPFAWDIAPCLGSRCKVPSEQYGVPVDIDANLIPRFALAGGFNFEFPFDAHDSYMSRVVELPGGTSLPLAPPEHMLVHKLVMARGADVQKFDFIDVAGILAYSDLDPAMLGKLVAMQRFTEKREIAQVPEDLRVVDPESVLQAFARFDSGGSVDSLLSELGCDHPEVIDAAREAVANADGISEGRQDIVLTALKQGAMISRMLDSLDRIEAEREKELDSGDGKTISLASEFPQEKLDAGIEATREVFIRYAHTRLGDDTRPRIV